MSNEEVKKNIDSLKKGRRILKEDNVAAINFTKTVLYLLEGLTTLIIVCVKRDKKGDCLREAIDNAEGVQVRAD